MHERSHARRLGRGYLALTVVISTSVTISSGCAKPGPAPVAPAAARCEAPWPQQLDHASTPETHRRAVHDMMTVLHMEEQLKATLDVTLGSQLQSNPQLRPFETVMRTFLGKYLSLDAIREPMTRIYMDRFSELEIVQITAFYRTPLGQRSVAEFPKMLEEGSNFGRRQVQEHMSELQDMIQEQIAREGGATAAPAGR